VALAEAGYLYDRRAAALRAQKSFIVGLVLTDVRNPALAELAMAIEDGADEAGCVVMMGYSGDTTVRQARIVQTMVENRLDGIVLSPASGTTQKDLDIAMRAGVPLTLVTRRVRGLAVDFVGPNNTQAGSQLGEHLVAAGVNSVAYFGNPKASTAADRLRGLRRQVEKAGHAWRDELCFSSGPDEQSGVDATRALLSRGPLPDSIVGVSDRVAIGVLDELQRQGIRPGRDVAVAGFENGPAAAHAHPGLTTVDTFMDRVGETAIRLLLDRIGDPTGPPATRLIPTELVERDSTLRWRKRSARSTTRSQPGSR
jgi:LacI family transcriptional regulator